ncbi:MAG TPA: hypothetical protein VK619_04280 [Pyrinomonadaceae bacterium]|nr:hypothetical protein [Pyrinomonadaceae bacterium]
MATRLAYLRLQILTLGMVGGLSLIACHTAMAQCASVLRDGDFELQRSSAVSAPWIAEGSSGIDIRRSLSYHGRNNSWSRNNAGWNAIRQPVRLTAGVTYTLKAFVRTSGNVSDGYFGFRDASQHPVSEIRFGPLTSYGELVVRFRPARTDTYNVFTGFWALNQDAWIQVDYVRVEFPCDDVISNPVEP